VSENKPVRVRFAPSPTGPLHIGGARTALYNWLFAQTQGGTFLLRVDDTDQARSSEESLNNILDGMRWLGMDWDEGPDKGGDYGPYFQMQRMGGYKPRVEKLLAEGKAYPCFCTPEQVQEGREAMQKAGGNPMYDRRCRSLDPAAAKARVEAGETHTIRFAIPEGKVVIDDLIKGLVEVDLGEVDDWVMMRGDGTPLYNLCSTLDDADMEITHIIRGEEHFTNGVKQVLLFEALGYEPPRFAHLPLILGKNGKKLSKRMAQTNLLDYRDQGYPPRAIVNFFTLLGWGFDAERDIFTMDEAIERFALDKVQKSGSILDEEKMSWMCGMYIRNESRAEFLDHVTPFLVKEGLCTQKDIGLHRAWFENLVACQQERVLTYGELPAKVVHYLKGFEEYEPKAWKNLNKKEGTAELLKAYRESLTGIALPSSRPGRPAEADTTVLLPTDKADEIPAEGSTPFLYPKHIENAARAFAESREIGFGQLVHPIRAALTGSAMGPSLFDIVYLLGREECEQRLDRAVAALGK
jgi:glutamyl-tRNA synthetase